MKFEVVEGEGQWIVLGEGVELARHDGQADALEDVARRLSAAQPVEAPVSLKLSYQPPLAKRA
jgi:hypothetical protein